MERGMASPEPRVVQCDAKAPPPSTEKKRQGSKKRPNPRGQSMPAQGNSAYTSRGTHEDGSEFRKFYTRGDLPCYISHGFARQLQWQVEVSTLDYTHFLPLFFEGLRDPDEPYTFIAWKGLLDLLDRGTDEMIVPAIPHIIMPIKLVLEERDEMKFCKVLVVLQKLVQSGEKVGEALVPFYRQILPVFNTFKNKRVNLGDKIQYNQKVMHGVYTAPLTDLINQTLELFERHGGKDAFINIKYMVPTYESAVHDHL